MSLAGFADMAEIEERAEAPARIVAVYVDSPEEAAFIRSWARHGVAGNRVGKMLFRIVVGLGALAFAITAILKLWQVVR